MKRQVNATDCGKIRAAIAYRNMADDMQSEAALLLGETLGLTADEVVDTLNRCRNQREVLDMWGIEILPGTPPKKGFDLLDMGAGLIVIGLFIGFFAMVTV